MLFLCASIASRSAGRCCYWMCDSCLDDDHWCSSEDRCTTNCNGEWCTGSPGSTSLPPGTISPPVVCPNATTTSTTMIISSTTASPSTTGSGPSPPVAGSVVQQFGQLRVQGNRIVAEDGQPVRLRGMSLFWSQWMPQYYNADTVRWLKEDWGITLIRAAMAVEEGGYLTDPGTEKARIEAVVDAAIAEGIYVIIDWHDHHAEQHLTQATQFFSEMAQKYGGYPNVLFEPYNEPLSVGWSDVIKPYHEQVLQVIRPHSDNVVILGTRTWSQEVDVASEDPVSSGNVAYTVHFYASTHKQSLRDRVSTALSNGVAIFATEWGNCEATGNGALDFASTSEWLTFFEENYISDANWAVADKQESCAALKPGASSSGGWRAGHLTASGVWMRDSLRAFSGLSPDPLGGITGGVDPSDSSCAADDVDCSSARCCATAGRTCFRKNGYWAGCRADCTPGAISPDDPPQHRTPWSCDVLSVALDQLICDAQQQGQQGQGGGLLSNAMGAQTPVWSCVVVAIAALMYPGVTR